LSRCCERLQILLHNYSIKKRNPRNKWSESKAVFFSHEIRKQLKEKEEKKKVAEEAKQQRQVAKRKRKEEQAAVPKAKRQRSHKTEPSKQQQEQEQERQHHPSLDSPVSTPAAAAVDPAPTSHSDDIGSNMELEEQHHSQSSFPSSKPSLSTFLSPRIKRSAALNHRYIHRQP